MGGGEIMTNTYAAVSTTYGKMNGIETGRMFGAEGLKTNGKVFAMEVKGRLVVKVPAKRAAELSAQAGIALFDPGHGRLMKEWVSVSPDAAVDWCELAEESRAYVAKLK
jgi:TfoX/Sxy family transcriptional regulator of competence genes